MLNHDVGIGIAMIEGRSIQGIYYDLTSSLLLGTVATTRAP